MSLEFVDELPAPKNHPRGSQYDEVVDALHARPGTWALVETVQGKTINNVGNQWRAGLTKRCKDCKVSLRTTDDGSVTIYARHEAAA